MKRTRNDLSRCWRIEGRPIMFLSPELAERALKRGVTDPHFWYAVDDYLGVPMFGSYTKISAEQLDEEFNQIFKRVASSRLPTSDPQT